jgi:hypothetical protein
MPMAGNDELGWVASAEVSADQISEELARVVARLDLLARRAAHKEVRGRLLMLQQYCIRETGQIRVLARKLENGEEVAE